MRHDVLQREQAHLRTNGQGLEPPNMKTKVSVRVQRQKRLDYIIFSRENGKRPEDMRNCTQSEGRLRMTEETQLVAGLMI
jgi:hypothetical protein